ncbi:hypothetical protein LI053_14710 [Clostridium perfringens]|uniref:hypothetical protein n=1 Tax=Clostridium perfringens TaxID=1502 RepID=UPI001A28E7E5|nr:hypothetical protein [Clostridium perfringens]MCX0386691.1 hypothetical protein [Clostridium perfringens]HAT4259236.1 hypothetical protein [Clostridium perfringens]
MKKSDLESGMVIETKDGRFGLIIKGTNGIYRDVIIWADKGFGTLKDFTEELTPYKNDLYLEIVRVYNFLSWGVGLGKIADEILRKNLKPIWERPKEIDWSKVPEWTKVQVRDCKNQKWRNRYFSRYNPYKETPYIVSAFDKFIFDDRPKFEGTIKSYRQCRIHPSVEIPKEWYKE